nr:response regulator [Paenibacillus roseus]
MVVDDEPLIVKGLTSLLQTSGLAIEHIYNAHSGYEALDYLRMEEIDLLITDIQMDAMTGIELMHQARLIKPWVQTIVISAHETFQYAQMAMRLGAKDYLIKPLNSEQFLDSVRNVLLKLERKDEGVLQPGEAELRESFRMEQPVADKTSLLNKLFGPAGEAADAIRQLRERYGVQLEGSYFSVLRLQLGKRKASGLMPLTSKDEELLQYAALNIVKELVGQEWSHIAFYSPNQELSILLQWNEVAYADMNVNKINLLDMIGRGLHFNIYKFLGIACVVGISQILRGTEFLGELYNQAAQAAKWHQEHQDHYVFYYGDFNWSAYTHQEPTREELHDQTNLIVERAKAYIDENFTQKGLTLHEVAQKNHVSPNYLSYLFKKITGFNLWEYVIKLRMELSKSLITGTDLRRYEIAERVGYESPEHFSKIFKKFYGISPSEMKK